MARDPDNIYRFVDYAEDIPERMPIPEMDVYTVPEFDLYDEKGFQKYIYYIEKKCVRTSFEYQQMVRYLRENMDMNVCSFFQSVSNEATTSIKIEIHHEPLSLYDIVMAVYNKRSDKGESLEPEMVAKEVMYNHYAMTVGLIPLSETVHQLVHNKYLFIPNNKVFGRWKQFVSWYEDYIDPETRRILQSIQEKTDNGDYEDFHDILKRQYIYVDTEQNNPNLYDVEHLIKGHINDLINGDSNKLVVETPKETRKIITPIIIVDE